VYFSFPFSCSLKTRGRNACWKPFCFICEEQIVTRHLTLNHLEQVRRLMHACCSLCSPHNPPLAEVWENWRITAYFLAIAKQQWFDDFSGRNSRWFYLSSKLSIKPLQTLANDSITSSRLLRQAKPFNDCKGLNLNRRWLFHLPSPSQNHQCKRFDTLLMSAPPIAF